MRMRMRVGVRANASSMLTVTTALAPPMAAHRLDSYPAATTLRKHSSFDIDFQLLSTPSAGDRGDSR
jgi:hypothetical protein